MPESERNPEPTQSIDIMKMLVKDEGRLCTRGPETKGQLSFLQNTATRSACRKGLLELPIIRRHCKLADRRARRLHTSAVEARLSVPINDPIIDDPSPEANNRQSSATSSPIKCTGAGGSHSATNHRAVLNTGDFTSKQTPSPGHLT